VQAAEGSVLAQVSFDGVTKRFGDTTAVDDLTLHVADGELLVLLGSSGCGKTTALRLVAGLEELSGGSVSIGERVVNDVDPKDRDVAMVFQSYALYPHLTVAKNIEFPLRQRGVDKEERTNKVKRAAESLGLGTLLDRKPAQLSGGQRQRVALARAIVREPLVFLMDEPLSNLDAALRVQTRADIVELQARLSTTTLYVTHDQVEAMTMGDRIAVMSEGKLQQVAPPEDLYARPANAFVAHFLGSPGMNLIEGMLVESGTPDTEGGDRYGTLCVAFPGASVPLPPEVADTVRGAGPEVVLGLRPESLHLSPDGAIAAGVIIVELLGAETHVICHTETGARVIVRQSASADKPKLGEAVRIAVDPDPSVYHLFDATDGTRLGGP
jgi:multiple sugar transport system ATP-binding protein